MITGERLLPRDVRRSALRAAGDLNLCESSANLVPVY